MHYNPKGCKLTSDPSRWEDVCVKNAEEEIRKSMQAWTEKNKSTAVFTYGGLTNIDGYNKDDGVSVIFWGEDLKTVDGIDASGLAIADSKSFIEKDGRYSGKIHEVSIVLDALDFGSDTRQNSLLTILSHEEGHVLGIDHPDHGVQNVTIMGFIQPWVINLPQPSDIAAIEYLYPFKEDCAPVIDLDDYSFSIEIWLPSEGRVVVDLVYRVSPDQQEYVEVVGIKPATSDKSCALKMGANGDSDQLVIPFAWLGTKLYREVILEVIPNTGRFVLLSARE